jgi:hypothetical protein
MNLVLYTLDGLNHSTSFFLQATVPVRRPVYQNFMHCNKDTKRVLQYYCSLSSF